MRFGINTFLWTVKLGPEHAPLLERIREMGFDGAEYAIFDAAEFNAAGVRQAFADAGLGATVCTVMSREKNPVSADASVRAAARDHLKAIIASVAEAGAEVLAGPMYAPLGDLPGGP